MSSKITIDELEKYLWGSAVLLRTHVDAGAYKQYIFRCYSLSVLAMSMMKRVKKQRKNTVKRLLNGMKVISLKFQKELTGAMLETFLRTLVRQLQKLSIKLKLPIQKNYRESLVMHLGQIKIVCRIDYLRI